MSDVECPYCGFDNEVCHDDGQWYEEDRYHEMECQQCEKYFVFTTTILFLYEPKQADCLNGEPHKFKPTWTYPRERTKMHCIDCDYERQPTAEERKKYNIPE